MRAINLLPRDDYFKRRQKQQAVQWVVVVPVILSNQEILNNEGDAQLMDVFDSYMDAAERALEDAMDTAIYSDGSASSGKQLTGLQAAVPVSGSSGVSGGIDRATWAMWRPATTTAGAALTSSTIQGAFNTMWSSLVRGSGRPDLIVVNNFMWGLYMASLQAQQRFASADSATRGFPTIKYMDADVVLDGGIGGFCPAKTMFFLNTKYLHYRPHSARNMVPLAPNKRYAINQDAEVQIIGWAGNLTCSGAQFQGRLISP